MEIAEYHSFKNEATRRFHDYFHALVKRSKVDKQLVFDAFGLSATKNPSQFFSKLRTGAASVTLDHVYIAKEVFNMNPGYWFDVSNQLQLGYDQMIVSQPTDKLEYYSPRKDNQRIGKALREILRRHGTGIKSYAEKRLHMTEQNLHKILKGDVTPNWWLVSQICEDHGESLEQLRTGPLPEGHYLVKIKMLEERVAEQQETIKVFRDQLTLTKGKVKRASA